MFAASSLLFVPGSRPDRFAKARAAGAGLTIVDLEDAVAAVDKDTARAAALAEAGRDRTDLAIRINAVPTAAGAADLASFAAAEILPPVVLVPMVETVDELHAVSAALGERCPELIPLIETPRGLRHALAIAQAPNVAAVMFGGADFAGELGVAIAWEPLLAARGALILACAEARVPAIDVPWVALDDAAGLAGECERAKALGFSAKAAIHPSQIATIETAFAPSDAEVAEAIEALAAYRDGGERAIRFKGRMLEAPIVKRYRAVLAKKGMLENA
ncbi:CoA ester lyase [Novosphingobium sp. Gsoil 351]|uniref:HpcH/HpaI aldolase/citrate lyase family protein n=1 Tax=Novosphingobium sp. Gsoil 351 TaxID=2675225 RepID=UPI0012B4BA93|nr:CoA ester lyase [Novosphingobium sp. Gsoil 351]QGN54445.1 CoA ester lyase [Novosphingobium sp. Gsoil 351]